MFLLWMFPLMHKTYYAFFTIKQRTIESSAFLAANQSFLSSSPISHMYVVQSQPLSACSRQSLDHMAVLPMVLYVYLNYGTPGD